MIRSYSKTHATLPELLTDELFRRLEVAIDTVDEERLFRQWLDIRVAIVNRLRRQPLVLINPDLNAESVMFDNDTNRYLVNFWGRWRIDILGAAFVQYGLFSAGEKILGELQSESGSFSSSQWKSDVQIGGLCQLLLAEISSERYKAALQSMRIICECLSTASRESG